MKPIQYWIFPSMVAALALYVAYRNYPWWHSDEFDKWAGLVIGTLVTVLCCGFSIALAAGVDALISSHSLWEWRTCWKPDMVSLRSSDGVHGAISGGLFMLSGFVDSRQTYFYYTKNSDGSFAPHRWGVDSLTRVYEEDRKDGQVVQWDKHFKKDWVYWFAAPDDSIAMDFHIPKGSIQQTFALK